MSRRSSRSEKEVYDRPAILTKKMDRLAEMVLASKNLVIYTGTGI